MQENHGQIFGLIKTNAKDKQMHVKVMPTGQIEAEIEPSQSFPFAHLNSKHSYSAHKELRELLSNLGISHSLKIVTPTTCLKPKIIQAKNPSHTKTILIGLAVLGIEYELLLFSILNFKIN